MRALSRRGRLCALVAGLAVVGACGSTTKSSAPSSTSAAAGASGAGDSVTIKSFMFHPNPLAAHVGQAITVTNADTTTHTLTADDHSFDTGHLAPGTSHQVTLTKAGTLSYHCAIHNFMSGVIHVTG